MSSCKCDYHCLVRPAHTHARLSPVADVIKQVRHESKLWLEHVSPLRRALGSSQTRCMKHSLGHILFAARNLVEVEWLPERVLIIHG